MTTTHTTLFTEYRAYLFSIAYRMLGSVMDAEDMVQDTFLRWQQVALSNVESPKSYLATIITRRCIDHLRSAKVQREQYIGTWLPEPLLVETAVLPADHLTLAESLSMAFLVMLETLSPTERAVFLLREVFDYGYEEISTIVQKSESNCRQIVRRAKQHLTAGRPRFDAQPDAQQQILAEFMQACIGGELDSLMALLAEDVVHYSDGGDKVFAAKKPVVGAEMVARFILRIIQQAPENVSTKFSTANGQPAFVIRVDGRSYGIMIFDVRNGRIQNIYTVVNPDKLKHI